MTLTLQDFAVIFGMFTPVIGAVYLSVIGRLKRIEERLDKGADKFVARDVCHARMSESESICMGIDTRVARVESKLFNGRG